MSEPLRFFAPVKGRLVSGDHDKLRTKDHQGKPLEFAKQQYDFGIAFPKADIWPMLAEQWFPWLWQRFQSDPQAQQRLQAWFAAPGLPGAQGGLSMKIGDGDKPNSKGKVSENTRGCYVFYCTSFGMGETAEPPKAVAGPNAQALVQIDLSQIKRGDYVTFSGSINPNGLQGNNCGVYLNCDTLWKLEDGPHISAGIDPTDAFSGAGLTGSFDPSQGAGASFGAPAQPQTGHVAPQAPAGAPPSAPGTTASHGSPAPTTPHYGILDPGTPGTQPTQPPAQTTPGPTPGAAPPLPGMPG